MSSWSLNKDISLDDLKILIGAWDTIIKTREKKVKELEEMKKRNHIENKITLKIINREINKLRHELKEYRKYRSECRELALLKEMDASLMITGDLWK